MVVLFPKQNLKYKDFHKVFAEQQKQQIYVLTSSLLTSLSDNPRYGQNIFKQFMCVVLDRDLSGAGWGDYCVGCSWLMYLNLDPTDQVLTYKEKCSGKIRLIDLIVFLILIRINGAPKLSKKTEREKTDSNYNQ